MRGFAFGLMVGGALLAVSPCMAADVASRLDNARQALARNDLSRAAHEIEQALADLHGRLGKILSDAMPAPLSGWKADAPEMQSLGEAGGGLSVTRAYEKGEATMNASLIVDSPAVAQAAQSIAAPQAGQKRVKVANEDAIIRFDAASRNGEVLMVLGNRAILEITGDNVTNADTLTDLAKGWNISKIKATMGF